MLYQELNSDIFEHTTLNRLYPGNPVPDDILMLPIKNKLNSMVMKEDTVPKQKQKYWKKLTVCIPQEKIMSTAKSLN